MDDIPIDVGEVLAEAQQTLDAQAAADAAEAASRVAARAARNYSGMGPVELMYAFADDALSFTERAVRLDLVHDFVNTVNWTEPFIIALLWFHCTVCMAAYKLRKAPNAMVAMIFILMGLIYLSEPLNTLGAEHWSKFCKQNYFDSGGMFAFIFFAAPLLVVAHVLLVLVCVEIIRMAIRTASLKQREQAKKNS